MHAEVQEEFDVVEDIPDQSYDSFLASKAWKQIRELVLRRCNRTCEDAVTARPQSFITPPTDSAKNRRSGPCVES